MGWTRRFVLFGLPILFLVVSPSLGAQETKKTEQKKQESGGPSAGLPLTGELARIEGELNKGDLKEADRHDLLVQQARLYTLAGDYSRGADRWTDGAFAQKGSRDDGALLSAAVCLIAMGEWEKADADVKTVLLTGQDGPSIQRARYLGAVIEAAKAEKSNIEPLRTLADQKEFADLRPVTLFLLWKITGDSDYRSRLLRDHGSSIEAQIATAESSTDTSLTNPPQTNPLLARTPFWLLLPGRPSLSPVALSLGPTKNAAVGEKNPVATSSSDSTGGGEAGTLQIGLFRKEENAQDLAKRLKAKGFSGKISRRIVNGESFWAVTVDPLKDTDGMIMKLKDAGFESFPL